MGSTLLRWPSLPMITLKGYYQGISWFIQWFFIENEIPFHRLLLGPKVTGERKIKRVHIFFTRNVQSYRLVGGSAEVWMLFGFVTLYRQLDDPLGPMSSRRVLKVQHLKWTSFCLQSHFHKCALGLQEFQNMRMVPSLVIEARWTV